VAHVMAITRDELAFLSTELSDLLEVLGDTPERAVVAGLLAKVESKEISLS